jgi:hypothetical protein
MLISLKTLLLGRLDKRPADAQHDRKNNDYWGPFRRRRLLEFEQAHPMNKPFQRGFFRPQILLLCLAAFVLPSLAQSNEAVINRVAMVGNERGMELRITASQPVTTVTQLVAGPDRFVIDIPNAIPGSQLRGLTLNQGGIRTVRVGLFRSNPPVTRVVLDLNGPGQYQVFGSGNSVIVRLGGTPGLEAPAVVAKNVRPKISSPANGEAPAPASQPAGLHVDFRDGLLSIMAEKATLAEVLYQVQRLTGADIPIPAGAEQERVVVHAGPGPAKDVISAVLTGTPFNFVLVGSEKDPGKLRSVILTPKQGGDIPEPPPQPPSPGADAAVAPVPDVAPSDVPIDDTLQQPPPNQPGVPEQMAPPTAPPAPPLQPDENTPPQPPADQVPN